MLKHLLFLLVLTALALPAAGQSWKKLRQQAEELEQNGDYASAAEVYEQAWNKKNKRTELIYKAGENYSQVRNYAEAANAYRNALDDPKDFPLAGLKYARALKQQGKYDPAIQAFREFGNNYKGAGKEQLDLILQNEIKGAELGKSMQPAPGYKLAYPGKTINTAADEFAPMPYGDQLLYASTQGGKAELYVSQKQANGKWSAGSKPQNIPIFRDGHVANTALAPDNSRIYLTICDAGGPYDLKKSRCELYVSERQNNTWGQPQRLPDMVNAPGSTNTQPTVVQQGSTEILYFVSDRPGGIGELDLWYTSRSVGSGALAFAAPVNLGPSVNTLGDEATPFFDQNEGLLYFSSNGQPSIGGFDVFKAQGELRRWTRPENAGMPINSPADDYYYAAGSGRAFVTTNRLLSGAKTTTADDDILELTLPGQAMSLRAQAFDQLTGVPVPNVAVSVYETSSTGDLLVSSQTFPTGEYEFELEPDKDYRIEVASPNYEPAEYTLSTTDPTLDNYGKPVYLNPRSPVTDPDQDMGEPPMPPSDPMPGGDTPPSIGEAGVEYTARGTSPGDTYEYTSSAPRYQGRYYKVQIIATRKDPATQPGRFANIQALGRMDTEYILAKGLHRVLIGDFFSEGEAIQALEQARSLGYNRAFIVRYDDGTRYGRVNF